MHSQSRTDSPEHISERFSAVAELFKQVSDPTRVNIFWILCHREESVSGLSAALEISPPAVSHHLRSLRDCGLITSNRRGKEVIYKITDTEVSRTMHLMVEQIMEIACPMSDHVCATPADTARQVHDYLLDRIDERVTIDELSRRFHINSTTLKQAFKEVYGTSLAAHTKEHRMEIAARLLRESDKSVADIAKSVGFESQSKFTAAFRERYSALPTDYRKSRPAKDKHITKGAAK